ncbi:MAG: hypothetical protein FWG03_06685 [Clostridiales bacterium]|nr:hypothetical protein [Clostridiales bacterium]
MSPGNHFYDDKISALAEYLKDGTLEYFHDVLLEEDGLVMWVDWREEDDAIVEYCEEILQTGELAAEVVDSDDSPVGYDIIITFRGEGHRIEYPGETTSRDITIITLNEVLQPDFEIRFCVDSDGSDSLAFLPLPAERWAELEKVSGIEKVNKCFLKVQQGSTFFG